MQDITGLSEVVSHYGPWGIVVYLILREGGNVIVRLINGDRRKENNGSGTIKTLADAQKATAEVIEQLNRDGSEALKVHKATNRGWQVGVEKRLDNHSERIDEVDNGARQVRDLMNGLLMEHRTHHPESQVGRG